MIKKRKVPLRICIGCQEKMPKKDLVRIVRTPEGTIVYDDTGKKPGRGAYICPLQSCFKKAQKGKRLERNLQQPVPNGLIEDLCAKFKIEPEVERC